MNDKVLSFSKDDSGVTLIELLITLIIIAIMASIGIVEYGRFIAKDRGRSATNELFQNMRLARTMAIKENRAYTVVIDTANDRYMIGFDQNGDNDLLDNQDTFGICNDTNGDRLPDTNPDNNGDGVPDCVKVVNLSGYGSTISTTLTTTPPNGPGGSGISNAAFFVFNPDGSAGPLGSVYIQETMRGYTYCMRLATAAGKIDLYVWDGDKDNASETGWTELR